MWARCSGARSRPPAGYARRTEASKELEQAEDEADRGEEGGCHAPEDLCHVIGGKRTECGEEEGAREGG